MEKLSATGYVAADELEPPLRRELGKLIAEHGPLLLRSGPPKTAHWAQNIWLEPHRIEFASINDAAKKLKAIQRNWALLPNVLHRRAKHIQDLLPHVSAKPIAFPSPPPKSTLGGWMLLESNVLLCSPSTSSPFPNGVPSFVENKTSPPSRAYLKLWEALTLCGSHPKKGDRCLDLGASPGGWTWVAAELGAEVVAIDRAPLAPALMKHPRVEFRKGDAFKFTPEAGDQFDWIFSDLACYPDKLLDFVKPWLDSGSAKNFVCTLKFQGTAQYGIAPHFAAIPGSTLRHLYNNKHELTWTRLML